MVPALLFPWLLKITSTPLNEHIYVITSVLLYYPADLNSIKPQISKL